MEWNGTERTVLVYICNPFLLPASIQTVWTAAETAMFFGLLLYVAVGVAHTDCSEDRSLLDPETGIESPLGSKSYTV